LILTAKLVKALREQGGLEVSRHRVQDAHQGLDGPFDALDPRVRVVETSVGRLAVEAQEVAQGCGLLGGCDG
jgi:hypothetical protein